MIRKGFTRKLFACAGAILLSLTTVCTGQVYADETEETSDYPEAKESPEQQTVVVGYYENSIFQEGASEDAQKSGYSYEYLQKVASIAGWKYEYEYGTWEEVYEKFINGEVDLIAGIGYSKEREAYMNYPMYAMGSDDYYLYCNPEKNEFSTDLTQLNDKKIGTLSGLMEDVLDEWLEANDIEAEVVVYDEVSARDEALEDGDIEAMIGEIFYADATATMSPVLSIGENDMYLCVTKDRTDLLDQLNKALAEINIASPYYTQELAQKYLSQNVVGIALSNREQQWLDEHDNEIVVGYLNDNMPFSATDSSGEVTGMIKDIMTEMVRELELGEDVTIRYQGYDDGHNIMGALKNGKVDIAFPVGDHTWYLEQYGIFHSDDIVSSSMNLVQNEDNKIDSPETIAVNRKDIIQEEITSMAYPEAEIEYYDSVEECLNAVADQVVDATYLNTYTLNGYINRTKYHNLLVSPMSEENAVCFGVRNTDSALLALLDRGINALDSDFAVNALYQYEGDYYDQTLLDIIQEHMISTLILVIIVVTIFAVLLAVIISKTKNQKKLDFIAHRDSMTGLLNRRAYEERVKNIEDEAHAEKQGYLSIDINGLKRANDGLGHEAGDELIKAAADCMKEAFGKCSEIYRTGGDEFVVLMLSSPEDADASIARLNELVAQWKGEFCSGLSLSIGYARRTEFKDQSILHVARIADERMYEAKAKHYEDVKFDRRRR
ncbi:MAG: GGDEF domain-containing protein [Eubacterium sp.]|nr:GGDEF domain-containing protein [Eubacterium sp.]